MKENKKQKLSITLLKTETEHDFSTCIKDDFRFEHKPLPKEKKCDKNWKLFIKKDIPLEPSWSKYLGIDIKTSNSSAVLFIPYNSEYLFAICFGYGSTALDKNKIVKDFGLKTALNSLDKEKIKSSDVFIPSDHSKQKRTQTTQDSSLAGHDMDKFSNILRRITGKTKEEYKNLFSSISASDSITIDSDKPLGELDQLCNELYKIYQKEDCKKEFPEVFYIQIVKNTTLITKLNDQLIDSLKNQADNVYLDIPDPIDFQNVTSYQISFKNRKKHLLTELNINEFYNALQKNSKNYNVNDLKKWEVILLDNNEQKVKDFSIYNCLIFDCSESGKKYHLSNAIWHKIDTKFGEEIEKINGYKNNQLDNKQFIDYKHNNEGEYNKELAKKLGKNAFCLDKKLMQVGGYDKIEPCDVLLHSTSGASDKNYFIHIKRRHHGSSGLSHLFNQGDVSLSLLLGENERFIKGIEKETNLYKEKFKKNPHVHYLIIDQMNNNERLPFFSQISLFKTIQNIKAKGTDVSWSFVKNLNE